MVFRDLRFADLRGGVITNCSHFDCADLSDADATNTQFTDNSGFSLFLKQDLIARGAVFSDY